MNTSMSSKLQSARKSPRAASKSFRWIGVDLGRAPLQRMRRKRPLERLPPACSTSLAVSGRSVMKRRRRDVTSLTTSNFGGVPGAGSTTCSPLAIRPRPTRLDRKFALAAPCAYVLSRSKALVSHSGCEKSVSCSKSLPVVEARMKHSPPLVSATPCRSVEARSSQLLPPRSSLPITSRVWKMKPGRLRSARRTSWDLGTSMLQSSPMKRQVMQRTRSCPSRPDTLRRARCQSRPETTLASNCLGCKSRSWSEVPDLVSSFLSISCITARNLDSLSSTLSATLSSTSSAGTKSTATESTEPLPPATADRSGGAVNLNCTSPLSMPCSLASASPPRMTPANSALQRASSTLATRSTRRTSCFWSLPSSASETPSPRR
mmetsp:Transcript_48408/g.152036  ORF Transcript_48408/g.152036 Transcript_48408/m.152036 type:complete len:376 (-) Transcript_48408:381-1508(-)